MVSNVVSDYDVVIVGASLAGSAAAIESARNGLKVAIVDRATFPRRKPCGEGLSPLGLKQLEHLGILDRALDLPHIPYSGYRIVVGRSEKFVRAPVSGGITVQRYHLDAAVLERALEMQLVSPFLGQKVEKIDGTTVRLSDRELRANKIILACGGNSALLKSIRCKVKRYGPSRAGISMLFEGRFSRPVDWITIIVKPTFEIYCTPLAEGFLNISLLKRSEGRADIHQILGDTVFMDEIFARCFFSGERVHPPQGRANIGNVKRICMDPNLILAGDALEEFDPIGGMGMSHALMTGIQAAHQILCESELASHMAVSTRLQQKAISSMRLFTRLTYRTLMGAKYFPPLLSLSASRVGAHCIKSLMVGHV